MSKKSNKLVLLKPLGDSLIKRTGLPLEVKKVVMVHVPLRVFSQKGSIACAFMVPVRVLIQRKKKEIFYNQLSFNFVSE